MAHYIQKRDKMSMRGHVGDVGHVGHQEKNDGARVMTFTCSPDCFLMPYAYLPVRPLCWNDEARFRKIRFPGDLLHRHGIDSRCLGKHGQGISRPRLIRKNIHDPITIFLNTAHGFLPPYSWAGTAAEISRRRERSRGLICQT